MLSRSSIGRLAAIYWVGGGARYLRGSAAAVTAALGAWFRGRQSMHRAQSLLRQFSRCMSHQSEQRPDSKAERGWKWWAKVDEAVAIPTDFLRRLTIFL